MSQVSSIIDFFLHSFTVFPSNIIFAILKFNPDLISSVLSLSLFPLIFSHFPSLPVRPLPPLTLRELVNDLIPSLFLLRSTLFTTQHLSNSFVVLFYIHIIFVSPRPPQPSPDSLLDLTTATCQHLITSIFQHLRYDVDTLTTKTSPWIIYSCEKITAFDKILRICDF